MVWTRIEGNTKSRALTDALARKARQAVLAARARAEYAVAMERIRKS